MIVLKHGKISKAVIRKKIILSPLGTGKHKKISQDDLPDSLERSLLSDVSPDPGLHCLGKHGSFHPLMF